MVIESVNLPVLEIGDKSATVRSMQILLNTICSVGRRGCDGVFGIETQRAVERFQRLYDLDVTGVVDGITWRKLITRGESYNL